MLCMQGEIEASINLTRYQVKPGSFITILPGTILQIHKVEGDLQIYFMGFSSEFTNHANIGKSAMDMLYVVKDSPIIERTAGPIAERLFFATCQNVWILRPQAEQRYP